MKILPFILLGWGALAGPLDLGEWSAGEELRLRLNDPRQERRTTSLNWADFSTKKEGESVRVILPTRKKLRIVIDPGHGGKDLGALGHYGVMEKKLCLLLGQLVRERLQKDLAARGIAADVVMSRDRDLFLSLRDRVRFANDTGADLFLSIHGNSSEYPGVRGFEVYFLSAEATDARAKALARAENSEHVEAPLKADVLSILSDLKANQHVSESSRFAETVFRAMARTLHANGRGVRQAPFTVLFGTAMPALLVEVGYLTHREEALLLNRALYLRRLSGAISSGVIEYALTMKDLG